MTAAAAPVRLHATRRQFLALCAAVVTASALPIPLRLRAARALAATSFTFTVHERAVLTAAANTIAPGAVVQTRRGAMTVPSAGDAGAVDYVEALISGGFLYAAGVRRPPYIALPPGVVAHPVPRSGTAALWTAKRLGWYGDGPRPTRPRDWPSELERLQRLYRDGVGALDAATAPNHFDDAAAATLREPVLREMQAAEVAGYNGHGEGAQPFLLTLLDHVCEACFGDPVYGGNPGWAYWRMVGFTGPSFIDTGGPGPGQGWTADQLAGPVVWS